jgi:hypothetical protein
MESDKNDRAVELMASSLRQLLTAIDKQDGDAEDVKRMLCQSLTYVMLATLGETACGVFVYLDEHSTLRINALAMPPEDAMQMLRHAADRIQNHLPEAGELH